MRAPDPWRNGAFFYVRFDWLTFELETMVLLETPDGMIIYRTFLFDAEGEELPFKIIEAIPHKPMGNTGTKIP